MNDYQLRGRVGGFSKAARYSAGELTVAARSAFLNRFLPDDENLSEEERIRRGQAALNAHMAKLARKSALARKRKT
jgi:hypothetical protein